MQNTRRQIVMHSAERAETECGEAKKIASSEDDDYEDDNKNNNGVVVVKIFTSLKKKIYIKNMHYIS